MAYLMLYGNGWTQRWAIEAGKEDEVRSQILKVGEPGIGRLLVVDPGSAAEVTLVVAWSMVAAAVVINGAAGIGDDGSRGQYP